MKALTSKVMVTIGIHSSSKLSNQRMLPSMLLVSCSR